ncbi:hypothetical protein GW7_00282 [Heterocephalus glaber]|uniref:Uncharacterized protein n=1 Tax=Heterocephalus glaber TaxID=10181 RepID=G5AZ40_HETGA|nr:hypothetical protein GW7_00282 [Heterocephalus glaber]
MWLPLGPRVTAFVNQGRRGPLGGGSSDGDTQGSRQRPTGAAAPSQGDWPDGGLVAPSCCHGSPILGAPGAPGAHPTVPRDLNAALQLSRSTGDGCFSALQDERHGAARTAGRTAEGRGVRQGTVSENRAHTHTPTSAPRARKTELGTESSGRLHLHLSASPPSHGTHASSRKRSGLRLSRTARSASSAPEDTFCGKAEPTSALPSAEEENDSEVLVGTATHFQSRLNPGPVGWAPEGKASKDRAKTASVLVSLACGTEWSVPSLGSCGLAEPEVYCCIHAERGRRCPVGAKRCGRARGRTPHGEGPPLATAPSTASLFPLAA